MPTTNSSHPTFQLRDTTIVETYAEAFPIQATRVIVTADSEAWAQIAATTMTGYATSVIACDAEAAIERQVPTSETPDGRPGFSILLFGFKKESLEKALINRVGQCVLTCPTTACYDGLPDTPAEKRISLGKQLRYFGDGFQIAKKLGRERFWRIPVMDGEFVCADRIGFVKGVAGGNFLLCGERPRLVLQAAEAAVRKIRQLQDVGLPFPGGIVRSGSKVGSRYPTLKASTNDVYCPTLRTQTKTDLPEEISAVYEIVIDGLSYEAVREAMRVGIEGAVEQGGVTMITAGNYGGKLGSHLFHLKDLFSDPAK